MRHAFVIHQFLPRHHTGTEQYVRALALEARRRGDEARVLTREPTLTPSTAARAVVDDEVEGIPVRRLALGRDVEPNPVLAPHDSPLAALELSRFLAEFRPDVVHLFHSMGFGAAALGAALAHGAPVFVHATDFFAVCPIATLTLPDGSACAGPPDGGFGCFQCIHTEVGNVLRRESLLDEARTVHRLAGPLHGHRRMFPAWAVSLAGRRERLLEVFHRARAIVAPSKFLREELIRQGAAASHVALVPYGLDLGRLEGLAPAGDRPVTFGFFGTIAPHKGALVLARAFSQISGDVRLVIRGRIGEFPEYSAQIEAAAAADARIRLGGPFAPRELGSALSEIDVLVVPSLWHENTPFAALEALAAGRPVIASDGGGLAEAVITGRGGRRVKAGDVGELAEALRGWSERDALARAQREIPAPRSAAAAFDDLRTLAHAVA